MTEENVQFEPVADSIDTKLNKYTFISTITFSFMVFFLWKYSIEEFKLDKLFEPFRLALYLAPAATILALLMYLRRKTSSANKRLESLVSVASILGVILGYISANLLPV